MNKDDNLVAYDATITKMLDGVIKASAENRNQQLNKLFENEAFMILVRENEGTFTQVLKTLFELGFLVSSDKSSNNIASSITIEYDDKASNATYAFHIEGRDNKFENYLFFRVSEQDAFATLAEQPEMTFDQFARFLYKSITNKLGVQHEATLSFDTYKIPV